MAAGWLSRLAGDRVEVLSGGSEPADALNPATRARSSPARATSTGSSRTEDPAGRGLEEIRPIRNEIGRRVRALMGELAVEPAT